MMELVIDSIRVSLLNHQRVVNLKEKEPDRHLPIWIGPPEADAIAVRLQEVSVPRPLTHDLLDNSIKALGGEAEETARAGANEQGGGFVINSSRGIIYASRNPEDFDYEAGRAAELLRNQINDALKPDGLSPQIISLE